MKSILIGYADAKADSTPSIVAGFDTTPQEQAEIFSAAKTGKKFPAGISRVEFVFLESRDIAIAINKPKSTKK